MASFKLTRCKLRDGWLVPIKNNPPVEVEWDGLVKLLAPSGTFEAKRTLRLGAAPNSFIVLVRQPSGYVSNFAVRNINLSGDIRGLVKSDPLLPVRFVDAYRVDEAGWDAQVLEAQKTV